MRSARSASTHRHAGDAGAGLGGDPGGKECERGDDRRGLTLRRRGGVPRLDRTSRPAGPTKTGVGLRGGLHALTTTGIVFPASFPGLLRGRCRVAAATTLPAPSCARTLQTRDLAGWWVAVDETFPTLWRRGTIVVMEELLIVTPDGRAENRSMTFEAPSPASCAVHGLCTDAPLIATARLALKNGSLTVSERKETTNRISFSAADPQLRRIAITATPAWTVTAVDGLRSCARPRP